MVLVLGLSLLFGQALAGKTVAISPGHGLIWDEDLGRYRTQRARWEFEGCGDCEGITEDFFTQRFVSRHLTPVLEAMGARVVVVRERELDDDDLHAGSGMPLWQVAAKGFVALGSAPASVKSEGDVTIRPVYAEWAGADIFVSLHANASGQAGGSTASGTSVYRYSCQLHDDGTYSDAVTDCDHPLGSKALGDSIQREIMAGVRAEWDPAWKDRKARVANFGEVRRLTHAPGVLIESAFFDNILPPTDGRRMSDNRALHEPAFREAFARSIALGVARYFEASAPALPLRVDGVSARFTQDGSLEVSWRAVPGASAYKVSVTSAVNEPNWVVATTSTVARARLTGLSTGNVYGVRVFAENSSGAGQPSQALIVKRSEKRGQEVLLVYAYDRRDAWTTEVDNQLTHALAHGEALLTRDVGVDAVQDEALTAEIAARYVLLDVALGKDGPSPALAPLLLGDQKLMVSGEDVAERTPSPSPFGISLARADSGALDVEGAGPFAALAHIGLDDGTKKGTYAVRSPDALDIPDGAQILAAWPSGEVAAASDGRVYAFAFGLETVSDPAQRTAIFDIVLDRVLPDIAVPVPPDPVLENPPAAPPPAAGPTSSGDRIRAEAAAPIAPSGCASAGDAWWVLIALAYLLRPR